MLLALEIALESHSLMVLVPVRRLAISSKKPAQIVHELHMCVVQA